MSRVMRCGGLRRAGVLLLAAVALPGRDPADPAGVQPDPPGRRPVLSAQDPGGQDPGGLMPDDMDMPHPAHPVQGGPQEDAARREGGEQEGRHQGQGQDQGRRLGRCRQAADSGGLKFSQDIAPILVANCVGCHSGDGSRGATGQARPEHLREAPDGHARSQGARRRASRRTATWCMRINGEEEPKMPQGGNRALSAGGDRQDHPVGQGRCPARRRDRPQGRHGHLRGHPRAVAPPAARPDAGQGARQEGHRGRAGAVEAVQREAEARGRAGHALHHVQQPAQRPGHQHHQGDGDAVRPPQATARLDGHGLAGEGQLLRVQRQERVHRVRPLGGRPRRRGPGAVQRPVQRRRSLTSRRSTRPGARRKRRRGDGPGGRRPRRPMAAAPPSGRSWAC